jgi:hypothetical protein
VRKRSFIIILGIAGGLCTLGILVIAGGLFIARVVTAPPPPLPAVGRSGDKPAQRTEVVSVPNWRVKVLETRRGDEAWAAIQAADEANEPPPFGQEYLLVKLWAKSTALDDQEHSISQYDFVVTGNKRMKYYTADALEPEPPLNAELSAGDETEGWVAFLINQDERDLVLILDELTDFRDNRFRFIALDEGASIAIPPELERIQPTELGIDQSNPASFGETVTTENWQITLHEVVRGEEAWQRIQTANMSNEPPEAGMEYILVNALARYIGTNTTGDVIDVSSFQTIGSSNLLYDDPSVTGPEPALSAELLPGGEYEGWIPLQAAVSETDLTVVFEDFSGLEENKRFVSLVP